ncbi:MAG: hypothetical protein WBJ84_02220 [Bacteroidales bacterium]
MQRIYIFNNPQKGALIESSDHKKNESSSDIITGTIHNSLNNPLVNGSYSEDKPGSGIDSG